MKTATYMGHQSTISSSSEGGRTPTHPTYDAPREICLGWIRDPKRWRAHKEAWGVVVSVYRGLEDPEGNPSPCWHWAGNYKDGRPIIRNRISTWSPIKLLFLSRCKRGNITSLCGHADCINPRHHTITPWKEHMASIRPTSRDEKTGRYLKGG